MLENHSCLNKSVSNQRTVKVSFNQHIFCIYKKHKESLKLNKYKHDALNDSKLRIRKENYLILRQTLKKSIIYQCLV